MALLVHIVDRVILYCGLQAYPAQMAGGGAAKTAVITGAFGTKTNAQTVEQLVLITPFNAMDAANSSA